MADRKQQARLLRDTSGLAPFGSALQANRPGRNARATLQRDLVSGPPVVALQAAPHTLYRHFVTDRILLEHRSGIDVDAEAEGDARAGRGFPEIGRKPVRNGRAAFQRSLARIFDREVQRLRGGQSWSGCEDRNERGNEKEVDFHIVTQFCGFVTNKT